MNVLTVPRVIEAPTNDTTNHPMVTIESQNEIITGFIIRDIKGALIEEKELELSEATVHLKLQMAPGVYFIRVFTNNGYITKRIAKK